MRSIHPRQWSEDDWAEFYSQPENFAQLFDAYDNLKAQRERFDLSSSQEKQMRVIERMIEAKLGL